jgi:asparagine synthase (glutamine-hydrolysing)
MSGIAGIIHFDGKPVEPGLIEKMTGAMAHRGPDGINHWVKGSVALGQCMLRTTPESLEEHQPLTNEDESLVLVMDGRVDNWEELRKELLGRGAVLRTRADAELVLRAYETWGKDCLAHIDGDFAFVIWNAKRRQAFCARDRMGNKPFNYHRKGSSFAFSSELHAILALPWVPEILNDGTVAQFLAAEWYSRDETFWQGVLRLVAAHQLVVDAQGLRSEPYWTPNLSAALSYTSDAEYADHYRGLFADIVRRLSRSFRPVAYEVSGGLDSSAIYAVASRLNRQGNLPAPGIQGFTLDFHDDPDADELAFSRAVGQHLQQQIFEIAPTKMPLSWYRDWAAKYREFPGYPHGVMGLGIRAAAREMGSRALVVGMGGDQWAGGSREYYAESLGTREWTEFFGCMGSDWKDFGLRTALWWAFRHGFVPLLPEGAKRLLRMTFRRGRGAGTEGQTWLSPAMRRQIAQQRAKGRTSPTASTRLYGQRACVQRLVNPYNTIACEMEERLCSNEGLDLRRPLHHPAVVQFSFSIPLRLKLRGRLDKYTHRNAVADFLPRSVSDRETKAEFSVVFDRHLPEMKRLLTDRIARRRGEWVERPQVESVFGRYECRQDTGWWKGMLWALFGCDALVCSRH